MNKKTNFYLNYPKLIEDELPSTLDDQLVLEFLETFYNYLLIDITNKVYATNRVKDKERCRNIAICLLDENFKDMALDCNEDTSAIFKALYKYFYGDIKCSITILRQWMVTCLKSGASSVAISALGEFAAIGEKFKNSDFHEKRKKSKDERDAGILNFYNNLISLGIDKQTAYSRVENRYSIGIRQVQRIIKKHKNDI
jgi:hypothetical protein